MRSLLIATALVLTTATGTAVTISGRIPEVPGLQCPAVSDLLEYRPPEASRILAMDGSVVADLSPQRRIVVPLAEISPVLRDGFIAVEDRRFWEHDGVDLRGIARAAWRNVTSLSLREGFSTITMQVVRNVFPEALPRGEKLRRKACEVWLAPRVERALDKQQILELYVNQVYMGSGLYGVEAAAQGYFGKSARYVNTAEAALLVGLVQSPEGFNPRRRPERAAARRNVVLDVMAREGVIPEAEAAAARNAPIRLAPEAEPAGPAPFFVAAVRGELQRLFGPDADVRGYRVFTGLDPIAQQAANKALIAQIERIEAGELGRYPHPTPHTPATARADSTASPFLEGLVVALDPYTGEIRALVGGRDYRLSQFDRAMLARRQPGSTFKPIVYAAALARGLPITTRVETTPITLAGAGTESWQPRDHLADTVGSLGLRDALALSSNLAAVRVGEWVGAERVAALAREMGLTTTIPPYPSIYLGAAEVVPVELIAAYAAFGNGGYRVQPTLITRVEDRHGNVLWSAQPRRERVLDEGVAYLTLSLLQDVIDRGTGAAIRRAGFRLPAAGKTGTTDESKDAWFIGLTPDLVAGVWLGFDRPATILPGGAGAGLAGPVWASLMTDVYRDRPAPPPWSPPASLIAVAIDETSGQLASADCPQELVRTEYFVPGTEPMTYCPIHGGSPAGRLLDRLWRGIRGIF